MYVKITEYDPGRPNGRLRIRILNDRTNELVTHGNGRTRWFFSEADADAWIHSARRRPPAPAELRVWR